MRGRRNLILLLVLLAILVGVNILRRPAGTASPLQPAGARGASAGRGTPAAIPDAELQLETLDTENRPRANDIRRNIFEYGRPAMEAAPRVARVEAPPERAAAPPPPPPPVRFYGFAEGSGGGPRRVLLTDGEGIFVARQGDTIANRYRVVSVSERSVEVEEIGRQRRWVITLEMP